MPTGVPQPAFILIRPQMGENIGSAARGMWNFGLDRMRLVEPRDGWPNARAVALAAGAGRLLDEALVYGTTAKAMADCSYAYATTARPRDLTKLILTPEEAMRDCAARVAAGERTAVLFGPERTGMDNVDIARANAVISVPVNPDFPSLNLAQCVLLIGYEWRRATAEAEPARMEMAGAEWAEAIEVEKLAEHYEAQLEEAGFFFPPHKAESMKLNLRNLWSRQRLTRADVQTLHGVLRQMVRWARRMDPGRDGAAEPRLPGDGAGDR